MAVKFFKNFYSEHRHCASSTGVGGSSIPGLTPEVLRSAMSIFQGDTVSPRELYAEEPQSKELLANKMKEIASDYPNLVGGGLRNKALSLLWHALEESDQKVWEDTAKAILSDVQLYVSTFLSW